MTQIISSNFPHSLKMASSAILRHAVATCLTIILLIAGFPSTTLAGGRIVSVQSVSIAPYEEAIDGFTRTCTLPMDHFFISGRHSVPLVERIQRLKPELILAVGLDALGALEEIHEIPIVFVMMLCPDSELAVRPNVTGVSMTPSIDVQLAKIHEILPDIRRIGVMYSPEKTGPLVEKASAVAYSIGIEILAVPVAAAREVPKKLSCIQDQIQIVWMIPDVKVMTRQTVEFFLEYSMENRIPLIAFSEKYVGLGAFMAFGLDSKDMGRQAGEMANSILSGKSPGEVPVQNARKVSVTINRNLVEKFGIRMNESEPETVKFVE